MTNKKTMKEMFAEVQAFLAENNASDELIEFIADRAEKAQRKATANRKETPTQKHNKEVAEIVYNYLKETGKKMQVCELMKEIPEFVNLEGRATSQYGVAVMRLLQNKEEPEKGLVGKERVKGVTKFFAQN